MESGVPAVIAFLVLNSKLLCCLPSKAHAEKLEVTFPATANRGYLHTKSAVLSVNKEMRQVQKCTHTRARLFSGARWRRGVWADTACSITEIYTQVQLQTCRVQNRVLRLNSTNSSKHQLHFQLSPFSLYCALQQLIGPGPLQRQ